MKVFKPKLPRPYPRKLVIKFYETSTKTVHRLQLLLTRSVCPVLGLVSECVRTGANEEKRAVYSVGVGDKRSVRPEESQGVLVV